MIYLMQNSQNLVLIRINFANYLSFDQFQFPFKYLTINYFSFYQFIKTSKYFNGTYISLIINDLNI